MRLRASSAIIFSLLITFCTASKCESQVALTHVTVIDVRDGFAKADTTVLIFGSRITAVGSSKDIPLPKQAREIDGRGKFALSSHASWEFSPVRCHLGTSGLVHPGAV
jgi:hypothetical protein